MASDLTYLDAIEIVLRKSERPLHSREIVREIRKMRLIDISEPKTPWDTVNARLSVDIKKNGVHSRFKRVAPGLYTLRHYEGDEYEAIPHGKRISPTTHVLVFPSSMLESLGHFHGVRKDYERYMKGLLNPETSLFLPRVTAEGNEDYKQIVSYVMIKHNDSLLRFTRGKITNIGDYFYGEYSIGFGGHVEKTDWNLFTLDDCGYEQSVYRELAEELDMDLGRAPTHDLRTVGVLNDDSSALGRCHFAFVHVLEVKTERFEKGRDFDKGEKSVNDPRPVPISFIADEFAGYEYWSKLCIQTYFGDQLAIDCHIHPQAGFALRQQSEVILIVGYIGSGKTEACSLLAQEFGYSLVPCSHVMQKIIGCGPIEEIGRRRLQDIGYEFINKADGHERLAQGIVDYMNAHPERPQVLDGLRYPETLEALANLVDKPITVVFVEATIDNLYKYFTAREDRTCSFADFLSIVNHPVERSIERFVHLADITVYNHGSKASYTEALRQFFQRELGE